MSTQMSDGLQFTVRTLPSTGIDGAFRLHLAPDSLEKLALSIGEICLLSNEDGDLGHAIAWRATDRMGTSPKMRPAKMTETMRETFGLKEGSQINISKIEAQILPADKILLTDVTETDVSPDEFDAWSPRGLVSLANCEAISRGMSFDVTARKGSKRRFVIEVIESTDSNAKPISLFRVRDSTRIVISEKGTSDATNDAGDSKGQTQIARLDPSQIGGLVSQIEELNKRLKHLWEQSFPTSPEIPRNQHVLIHGYEGTGKSMLLDHLERSNPSKSFRIAKNILTPGSTSKNRELIQQIFKKAMMAQPSILLIDDLETIAPSDDSALAPALQAEFKKLKGTRAMVIATASSPTKVEKRLLGPDEFSRTIELSIPDVKARTQIVKILQSESGAEADLLSHLISTRTHGFTGKDLAILIANANLHVIERFDRECKTLEDDEKHSSTDADTHTARPKPSLRYEDLEKVLPNIRPTALREIFFETPKIKWSDIGGSESISQRFDETIGWPLLYSDKFEQYNLKPPKGILLYGPPGCSKTLTAQAVASTYDLNFIAVKGAELISMYVGESERAVRDVFRKARQAAPCVIFFDEIDSIGAERDHSGTKGLNVLTTLLTEMDGFEEMKGVLVLAATNKPEIIDPALMRPGRFDTHIYVGPPNAAARQAILDIGMRGMPIAEKVDMARLVTDTEGYSGAEIVRLCQVAKLGAMRRHVLKSQDVVATAEDFQAALSQTSRGITLEMLDGYETFGRRAAL